MPSAVAEWLRTLPPPSPGAAEPRSLPVRSRSPSPQPRPPSALKLPVGVAFPLPEPPPYRLPHATRRSPPRRQPSRRPAPGPPPPPATVPSRASEPPTGWGFLAAPGASGAAALAIVAVSTRPPRTVVKWRPRERRRFAVLDRRAAPPPPRRRSVSSAGSSGLQSPVPMSPAGSDADEARRSKRRSRTMVQPSSPASGSLSSRPAVQTRGRAASVSPPRSTCFVLTPSYAELPPEEPPPPSRTPSAQLAAANLSHSSGLSYSFVVGAGQQSFFTSPGDVNMTFLSEEESKTAAGDGPPTPDLAEWSTAPAAGVAAALAIAAVESPTPPASPRTRTADPPPGHYPDASESGAVWRQSLGLRDAAAVADSAATPRSPAVASHSVFSAEETLEETLKGVQKDIERRLGRAQAPSMSATLLDWLERLPAEWAADKAAGDPVFSGADVYERQVRRRGVSAAVPFLPKRSGQSVLDWTGYLDNLHGVLARTLLQLRVAAGRSVGDMQLSPAEDRFLCLRNGLSSAAPSERVDAVTACFVYTYELKTRGGDVAKRQVAGEASAAMRGVGSAKRTDAVVALLRPLLTKLGAALRALAARSTRPGACFRRSPGPLPDAYRIGSRRVWRAPSSALSAPPGRLCTGRGSTSGCIVVLTSAQPHAVPVADVCMLPADGELLLPAGTVFEVCMQLPSAMRLALSVACDAICLHVSSQASFGASGVAARMDAVVASTPLFADFAVEYVEPPVADKGAAAGDEARLFERFDAFLEQPVQYLLVSGEGGTGKSCAAVALANRCLQRRRRDGSGHIALFSSFADPLLRCHTGGAFSPLALQKLLCRQLCIGEEDLAELGSYDLVFFWDALDECGVRPNFPATESMLSYGGVAVPALANAKHVVTCRSDFAAQFRITPRQLFGDVPAAQITVLGLDAASSAEYVRRVCEREVKRLRDRLRPHSAPANSVPPTAEKSATKSAASTTRPFPDSLGPFGTVRCDVLPKACSDSLYVMPKDVGAAEQLALAGVRVAGRLSPPSDVTLDRALRKQAGIPPSAHTFRFAYPTDARTEEWERLPQAVRDKALGEPIGALLLFGGFMYFNSEGECVSARALSPGTSLRFNGPHFVSTGTKQRKGLTERLRAESRFEPVTIEQLRQAGAHFFAWLLPGEDLGGGRVCTHGGFLYLFHPLHEDQSDARYFMLSGDDAQSPRTASASPRASPKASGAKFQLHGAAAAEDRRRTDARRLSESEERTKAAVAAMRCSQPSDTLVASLRSELALGGVLLELPQAQHNPAQAACGRGCVRMDADGWQPGSPRRIPGRRGGVGRTLPQMYLFDLGVYRKVVGLAVRGGTIGGQPAFAETVRVYTGSTTLPTCSAVASLRVDAHMPLIRTGLSPASCRCLSLLALPPAVTRYVALVDPCRSDGGPVLLHASPVVTPTCRRESGLEQCTQAATQLTNAVVTSTFGAGRVGTWPLYIAVEAAGARTESDVGEGQDMPRAVLFRRWLHYTTLDRLEEVPGMRKSDADPVASLFSCAQKLAIAMYRRQQWQGLLDDYAKLFRVTRGTPGREGRRSHTAEDLLKLLPLRCAATSSRDRDGASTSHFAWRHRSIAEYLLADACIQHCVMSPLVPEWLSTGDLPLSLAAFFVDHPALAPLESRVKCYNAVAKSAGLARLSLPHRSAPVRVLWSRRDITLPANRVRRLCGHSDKVRAVVGTPTLELLASGGYDARVTLWNGQTGEALRHLEGHDGAVSCVAIARAKPSRASKLPSVASGSWDCTVMLWDWDTGKCMRTLRGHTNWVRCVAGTPNMDTILSGSHDSTIVVWDAVTGEQRRKLKGHEGTVTCVSICDDGLQAISGSTDRTLIHWSVPTGEIVRRLVGHTDEVTCVATVPHFSQCVSGGLDYRIIVWNVPAGEAVRVISGTHTGYIRALVCDKALRRVVSGGSDGITVVWDAVTGDPVRVLRGHDDAVFGLAASAEHCTEVVSASFDHTLCVWFLPESDVKLQPMLPGDPAAASGFVRITAGDVGGAVPPSSLEHSEYPGSFAHNALTLLGVPPRAEDSAAE